jgi:hypothetical protein
MGAEADFRGTSISDFLNNIRKYRSFPASVTNGVGRPEPVRQGLQHEARRRQLSQTGGFEGSNANSGRQVVGRRSGAAAIGMEKDAGRMRIGI